MSPYSFDSAVCPGATLDDLSTGRIRRFAQLAQARGFPLAPETNPRAILEHLRLLRHEAPTHAAILLFGYDPQQFLPSARIQVTLLNGPQVACQGTVFEMLDEAMYQVLSILGAQLPTEALREALVNAAAHRDYASNQSIQVRVYQDRVEIRNPGAPDLTPEQLCRPHGSIPRNPLLAEPLYLSQHRPTKGTGTTDIVDLCRKAALLPPQYQTADDFCVTFHLMKTPGQAQGSHLPAAVEALVRLLGEQGPLSPAEILKRLALKSRADLRERYILRGIESGLVEPAIPDKPKSRLQQYRLTTKGKALFEIL